MRETRFSAAKAELNRDAYELSDEGLILPRQGIKVSNGTYYTDINGVAQEPIRNLMPNEGLLFTLEVLFGDASQPTGFYLAPFGTNSAVEATWTADTFATVAQEWTEGTGGSGLGYNEASRQEWVGVADGQVYTNVASKATFTIVCSTNLNISGVGMIANDSTKGGTSGGKLISAARYGTARTVYPADNFGVVYTIQLQDS